MGEGGSSGSIVCAVTCPPEPCTAAISDPPPDHTQSPQVVSPSPCMVTSRDSGVQVLYDGGPYWNTDPSIGMKIVTFTKELVA